MGGGGWRRRQRGSDPTPPLTTVPSALRIHCTRRAVWPSSWSWQRGPAPGSGLLVGVASVILLVPLMLPCQTLGSCWRPGMPARRGRQHRRTWKRRPGARDAWLAGAWHGLWPKGGLSLLRSPFPLCVYCKTRWHCCACCAPTVSSSALLTASSSARLHHLDFYCEHHACGTRPALQGTFTGRTTVKPRDWGSIGSVLACPRRPGGPRSSSVGDMRLEVGPLVQAHAQPCHAGLWPPCCPRAPQTRVLPSRPHTLAGFWRPQAGRRHEDGGRRL